MATAAVEWRLNNPEKHRDIYRRANNKANLRVRFGLTVDEFNVLVEKSDGKCGICRKPESRKRRLCLDHDHNTGALRGFLCSACNLWLASSKDDPIMLEKTIRYLKFPGFPKVSDEAAAIPMILHCPMCHTQHLDEGAFATKVHAVHACQECGLAWRPAIVPTVGVRFLPGFKNVD
jgi:hypothetical protein